MKKTLVALAVAALALVSAVPPLAQKKQLVIVVKGLDNPFFEAIHQGCEKWNKENASSDYALLLYRPGVDLGRSRRSADRPGHARQARHRGDGDLAVQRAADRQTHQGGQSEDPGHDRRRRPQEGRCGATQDLSRHRQLPDGLPKLGEYLKKAKPNGGTVCTIEGNAAADNILRRAQGPRDALSGKKGLAALKGEGGWTEVAGCPVFTNDDGAKGVQAMTGHPRRQPEARRLRIMGGWPLFGAPQPYRDLTEPYKDQIASKRLVIVAADTIGDEVAIAKEGLVEALVGQRPFEMGYKAPSVMIDLIEGKKVDDPVFTGLDECTKDTADTCIQK